MEYLKNKDGKIIFAGPCSIESQEQLEKTIEGLDMDIVTGIRGGVWKPRTKPGGFEGHGEAALRWIWDIQMKTNHKYKFATEIAKPEHVYACEKYKGRPIDIYWVGARTTTNPFAIQELIDSIKSKHTPVFIKNPMNPDLDLWIGAVERFIKGGHSNIGLIFRGFSMYREDKYRNTPLWKIPIEMKRRFPNIPLIVDPSHIAGTRELIYEISQKSYDLDFDGLIIESHYNPEIALTDKNQQLKPDALNSLLHLLDMKTKNGNGELEIYRNKIDDIDHQIMDLFKERFEVSKQIGKYKRERHIPILDMKRWNKILNEKMDMARQYGLDDQFIAQIYEIIHQESIKVQ